MLITHRIVPTVEDVDTALKEVIPLLIQTFTTQSAQEEAIKTAKDVFMKVFETYLNKSFIIGKNIGEAKADEKDLAMY